MCNKSKSRQALLGGGVAGWGRRGEMGDKGRSWVGQPMATGDTGVGRFRGQGGVRTPLLD